MPYAQQECGIYKIVNTHTGCAYVGQSRNIKKRLKDHQQLLRMGKHPNPKLQHSYNKHGVAAFVYEVVAHCEDAQDLDAIETDFLTSNAFFDEPVTYNIAKNVSPMGNRKHTDATKAKIAATISKKPALSKEAKQARSKVLSEAQNARYWGDPEWVSKIKYILANTHLSYAARGRHVGNDTTSVRNLFLKYKHLTESL